MQNIIYPLSIFYIILTFVWIIDDNNTTSQYVSSTFIVCINLLTSIIYVYMTDNIQHHLDALNFLRRLFYYKIIECFIILLILIIYYQSNLTSFNKTVLWLTFIYQLLCLYKFYLTNNILKYYDNQKIKDDIENDGNSFGYYERQPTRSVDL